MARAIEFRLANNSLNNDERHDYIAEDDNVQTMLWRLHAGTHGSIHVSDTTKGAQLLRPEAVVLSGPLYGGSRQG